MPEATDNIDAGQCVPPSRKRSRVESPTPHAILVASPNGFVHLPLEVLSEILSHPNTTKDILSVTRTCKFLCDTLLEKSNENIWRKARERALPLPIPDQQGLLSEAAYASFLFDGGPCEACGTVTGLPYVSFALRLRLCPNDHCTTVFVTTLAIMPTDIAGLQETTRLVVLSSIPQMESTKRNGPLAVYSRLNSHWPTVTPICRRTAWTTALNEYENMTDRTSYAESTQAKRDRKKKWMPICVNIYDWLSSVQDAFRQLKKENEAAGKGLATLNGWDFWDMMNCTVYGPYHKHKNRIYEQVGGVEFELMKPKIEVQLLALQERRKRRVAEAAHRKSREEALQHHSRLCSAIPAQGKSRKPVPAVSAFLKLPVLDLLQSPGSLPDGASVSKTLKKDPLVTCILENQVAQWTDKARQDFGVMLGYPAEWKSANKSIVHPAERLSARYLCKKCKYFPAKYRDYECLDFAGACAHQCVIGNKKAKKNGQAKWSASNFKKDDKASAALEQLIAIFGHDNQKSSAKDVLSRKNYVLCVSCDPPLYVCTAGVAGHSHRHEEMKMQIAITGYDPLVMGAHDVERGLVRKLLGPDRTVKAVQEKINFGCRHCLPTSKWAGTLIGSAGGGYGFGHLTSTTGNDDTAGGEQPPPSGAAGEEERNERKEKPPKLFSFNGVRSHLKAKHKIENIRDEDFFCDQPHGVKL